MVGRTARALTYDDLPAMHALAVASHSRLRAALPFLPDDAANALEPNLSRLAEEGIAFGVVADGRLRSYLGAIVVSDLRGATTGSSSLEWAHASADSAALGDARHLYRELARELVRRDCRLHVVSILATEEQAEAAFVQLGFGRFLANRAVPLERLLVGAVLGQHPDGYIVERAVTAHTPHLARLHALLGQHLAASPIFLPEAEPWTAAEWARWLLGEHAIAFVALQEGRPVGYIKAQEPQFDVAYVVQGEGVLAINGLFVEPEHRGTGIAQALLTAVAREGTRRRFQVLAVDHETANLEADRFWGRSFLPISWALERRV